MFGRGPSHRTPCALQAVPHSTWRACLRDVALRGGTRAPLVRVPDATKLWTTTIFYGHELRLALFEAVLLGVLELELRNIALSACLAWLLMACVTAARRELGRRHVARCTHVDKSFLS